MGDPFQLPFASREERIAYNEAWARDLNRRRAEWKAFDTGGGDFRCECWAENCEARIELSEQEWQEVRSSPTRFAVAPGHLAPDLEAVIEKRPGFWMIEKHGPTGAVADNLS